MARISRIRGPTTSVNLGASLALLDGFSLTRNFGRGLLDISVGIVVLNLNAATTNIVVAIVIDGVEVRDVNIFGSIATTFSVHYFDRVIQRVAEGLHTIELHLSSNQAVSVTARADTGSLIVVELPPWDNDANLITL